ncbi:MAG: 50S ribosomal protein L23 [Alphaproteobacteria bacterium]|nr:50S ribosomal protein L23 [Alphaproteobacteria bacterium]MBQ3117372.1 50S ribosomal protein L23 [Alphaproteobacteria bacterium]MBQ6855443.1 50S ribosomal protein L23 [Alphaproteobacteria bacterium]MBR3913672.1 50S ribosomal protein L23 [Alphaproteobacteria bacterium]MBR4931630.1 50S ribosomal protein L23 [Alphaproteobacteria bacterium]
MIKKNETVAPETYDVIRRPLITEKAMKSSEHNQVVFIVDLNATKPQIKKAVETVFGVKVKSVNTLRQSGKTKTFRGVKGVRNETKKAIVTLAEGQSIDVTAGI